jgi:hypothetical protein
VTTPAPWYWTVNPATKHVLLFSQTGMSPTVMDFVRYGMQSAQPRFRDARHDLMVPASEMSVVIPGREHHADWCRFIDHPDARLIQASPKLKAMLEKLREFLVRDVLDPFAGGDHELIAEIDGLLKEAS